jgi:predicted nicotinamide N-methyase
MDKDEEDSEIDTRMYDRYLSLMSDSIDPSSGPPPDSYVTYYWKPSSSLGSADRSGHETITLLESRTTIESGTTGLRTWYASFVLASYLIENVETIRDQTVLELGCGSGFLGIIVAAIQQKFNERHESHRQPMPAVLLTDVNGEVLSRCRDNVQLCCNQSSNHPNITFSIFDWFDALSLLRSENTMTAFLSKANVGVVIGADIVFDPILVPPLVATLRLALSFKSTRMAVVALTVRNEQTLAHFVREAVKELSVEEVPHAFTSATYFDLDAAGVDAGLDVKIFKFTFRNSAS